MKPPIIIPIPGAIVAEFGIGAALMLLEYWLKRHAEQADRASREEAVRPDIERRAHEIWEERGRTEGHASEDWNRARSEIFAQLGWL